MMRCMMKFYTCPTLHSNRTQNMSQQCHLSMNCFLFHKRLCLHWDHNGVVFKRCLYYIFACSALSHFDSVWYNLCLILAVLGIRVSTQKWTNLDSFRQFPTYRSSQFKFFIIILPQFGIVCESFSTLFFTVLVLITSQL